MKLLQKLTKLKLYILINNDHSGRKTKINDKAHNISMVSGTNHSSLDRHFFQNDDKNDKTHRAQNVISVGRLDAAQNVQLSRRET